MAKASLDTHLEKDGDGKVTPPPEVSENIPPEEQKAFEDKMDFFLLDNNLPPALA